MAEAPALSKYQPLTLMASFVLVVAAMYWGRTVMIPVALAILLAFLLSPVVRTLQQRGLGRLPAVVLVVLAAFLLLGGICWIVAVQFKQLAEPENFARYKENVDKKIAGLHESIRGTVLERLLTGGGAAPSRPAAPRGDGPVPKKGFEVVLGTRPEKPVPVVVQPERPDLIWRLTAAIDPVVNLLGSTGLIVLLVILMLIHREELRNRLIRLAGHGRLAVTTRALDEASQRISLFLMRKSIVNGVFGVVIGVGLIFIGVPYPFLWGFLVAVLRFIPSLGTWLAMLAPLALALVALPEWLPALWVFLLFAVLELFATNVVEPYTYGQHIGVSAVALVVALAFWTWLWGPVGLVLATPLTVCLAVLGKYFPQFEFLNVLIGDRPALEADVRYYQRLLARDQDEATDIVENYVESHSAEEVYDGLLLPALTAVRVERERGQLSEEDELFTLRVTRDILEDLGGPAEAAPPGDGAAAPKALVLGYPIRDPAAEVALLMLGRLLDPKSCELELVPAAMLSSELALRVEEKKPGVLCIISVAPGGMAMARSQLKRLRGRFPGLKIVVARLGASEDVEKDRKALVAAGADFAGATLLETRNHVTQLAQALSHRQPSLATASTPA